MQRVKEVEKRRKSVRLSKDERKALKDFRDSYATAVECADAIGISYQVLERVLLVGSGSPDTINKVRAAIVEETATK